jgi:pantoate--beta-alanine ligase
MRKRFEIVRAPAEMRALAEDRRRDGQHIAVVPTMGYLHDGHLSLLREGRRRSDFLVMTLFVNPTQFGPNEDLARYPRDEAGDLDKARSCGVDAVFAPHPEAMYTQGHQTSVLVAALSQPLCGAKRPGHFAGVATVVTKLFHATCPHVALFGQKDYQQLALIRRMVVDLDFGIAIVGMPIVREADGLAMSSRNAYLDAAQRAQATALFQGLCAARTRFAEGVRDAETLLASARQVIAGAPLIRVDYLELRDAETLAEVTEVDRPAVLAVAAFVGATRLIDNIVLATPPVRQ